MKNNGLFHFYSCLSDIFGSYACSGIYGELNVSII